MGKTSNRDGDWTSGTKKFVDKFHIENYSKTSGIVVSTYYTAATLENVSSLIMIVGQQNNDETDIKEVSIRVTIDGEVMTGGNISHTHNDKTYYDLVRDSEAIGDNPTLSGSSSEHIFGFIQGTANAYGEEIGGHDVKIEFEFDDAPGTNQTYKMDIIYKKKEESA